MEFRHILLTAQPINWYKRNTIPPSLDDRPPEPVVEKFDVVCDDQLHLWNIFTVTMKKAVELMHGSLILVTKSVDLAILIAFRRIVRLGRLI